MGLSRRNAFILYTLSLLAALAAVSVSPDIANGVLMGLLAIFILFATIYYLIKNPQTVKVTEPPKHTPKYTEPITDTADVKPELMEDNVSINTMEVMAPLNPANTMKKPRLHYLDNVKSILTSIVVIHHVTCSFSGGGWYYNLGAYYNPFLLLSKSLLVIDQSYFMCLFFFISGYFTPSSYQKKGTQRFLYDKFKRLGVPFLVYLLILGPIHNLLIQRVFLPNGKEAIYMPDPGPCWFLGWLLLFNSCYCVMDENIRFYEKKLPSTVKLIMYGIFLGIIQLFVLVLVPNGFIFMPIVMGSLPFDIMFFIAGTLAKRNEWLKTITASYLHIILTVICSLLMIGIIVLSYAEGGIGMPAKGASTDCGSDESDGIDFTVWWIVVAIGISFVFCGIVCIVVSLGMIQFAAFKMNYRSKVTKFFSSAAYTVYIIHPLVITPVTWSFTRILYYFNGVEFVFCDGDNYSKTHFGNNYLVFVGWVYAVVVSLVIVWPIAWAIKQIPGFNKIL